MPDKPKSIPKPGARLNAAQLAEVKLANTKLTQAKQRDTKFSQQVGDMAARKLKAQRHVNQTVWSGLGMMGLVGWSVAIPTVLSAALGIWLDEHYPSENSWTLTLLIIGLCLGCFTAWRWVDKEYKEIHRDEDENNDD
ncbi:AtpZ/AtpI family protein [Colwellia sp. MB02u-6]|uniref:AtpZ/AtpI family protein n=1 Tax=Colwellia sp. MB02u-6 TaxID=2759824 RepID=UPI0015F7686D|nr:AtpZ/AtpI family protein [Colwellia sp. MB02u-6]MBA6327673.1 AtpZ/AtpI family protein [Colwellia sp. MB02u-6]